MLPPASQPPGTVASIGSVSKGTDATQVRADSRGLLPVQGTLHIVSGFSWRPTIPIPRNALRLQAAPPPVQSSPGATAAAAGPAYSGVPAVLIASVVAGVIAAVIAAVVIAAVIARKRRRIAVLGAAGGDLELLWKMHI